MLYLVSTDHFGHPPPPPEELPNLTGTVIASLEALMGDKRVVAGGVPAGQKKHVFIVEAASNDEVTELVQGLPFWLAHQWEITPLESWEHHVQFLRSL